MIIELDEKRAERQAVKERSPFGAIAAALEESAKALFILSTLHAKPLGLGRATSNRTLAEAIVAHADKVKAEAAKLFEAAVHEEGGNV